MGRSVAVVAAVALLLPIAAPAAEDDGTLDRLRAAADGFARLDTDGNGVLSRAELPEGGLHLLADGDVDGVVTERELRALCTRLAREAAGLPPEPSPAEAPRPAAPKRWTAEEVERLKVGDPRFDPAARARDVLEQLDRAPRDGRIQRSEHAGAEAADDFFRHDGNRDGVLDGRELLSWMHRQLEGLKRLRKNPPRAEFVGLFDLDRDNGVSLEEYEALGGRTSFFHAYDANRDGRVSFEETRYPERRTGKYGATVVIVPPEGLVKPEDPVPRTRSPWDLFDGNRDGVVTPSEFGGGDAVFRRLDRDGNGVLTIHDA